MKVIYISPSFYPAVIYGGPIFSTYHTCNNLNKLDVDVAVCTTNANGDNRLNVKTGVYLYDLGFPVKYYNDLIVGRFSLSFLFMIWRDILSADIIHVQSIFSLPTPISLFYAWFFKRKVALSPRGSLGSWCLHKKSILKKIWLKILIKPFLKNVIWHATSEQEKNEIIRMFNNQNVRVIPNGIDLGELSSSKVNVNYFFDSFGVKFPTKIVVSMGRLEKKKGFDILIRAIYTLIHQGHDIHLFVAGPDYGELCNLTSLCRSLCIEDKVTFVGHIDGDEKVSFLGAADIFAMPSHNENFGNVYAEALACGTPIVASTNTPWQDVEKFRCGRWVDNTVEATAAAILALLSEDRLTLKENSQNFINKFSWHNVANEFKKLYQELD